MGGSAPQAEIWVSRAEGSIIGWVGKNRKINDFRITRQSNLILLCPVNNVK